MISDIILSTFKVYYTVCFVLLVLKDHEVFYYQQVFINGHCSESESCLLIGFSFVTFFSLNLFERTVYLSIALLCSYFQHSNTSLLVYLNLLVHEERAAKHINNTVSPGLVQRVVCELEKNTFALFAFLNLGIPWVTTILINQLF
jgi:hypothetical protein